MQAQFRDDPSNWTDDHSPAPDNFERQAFQQKLDEICGTARGQSIVRVVWGGEEEIEVPVDFTTHGTATEYRKIGRHRTRVPGVAGKVRKRRWIFEEWQPPEQIPQDQFIRLPWAGGLFVPPSVVEAEAKGEWVEIYIVADHTKCLPEVCNSLEYFCFGDYREPGAEDLQKFARVTSRKFEQDVVDPFSPLGQNKINLFNKRAIENVENREREEDEALQATYTDVRETLSRVSTSGKG
jgi:hypothetical protein